MTYFMSLILIVNIILAALDHNWYALVGWGMSLFFYSFYAGKQ